MKPKTNTQIYMQHIGHLTTEQFGILQRYLHKVNEPERYAMLFRQLELEIEKDKEDAV